MMAVALIRLHNKVEDSSSLFMNIFSEAADFEVNKPSELFFLTNIPESLAIVTGKNYNNPDFKNDTDTKETTRQMGGNFHQSSSELPTHTTQYNIHALLS